MSAEERLKALGVVLPTPMNPAGAYRSCVEANGMVYVSGQGPARPDGTLITGRVPDVRGEEEAIEAARLTALNSLSQLRAHLGSLDRIKEVVRVFGLVNAAPGFQNHPKVIDGFSQLMIEVFGDAAKAARCAVGASSLPFDITVEVEMSVLLKD